jgi:hypothetical protein
MVLAFEHTSPGLRDQGPPPPEVAELKKVFSHDPNLWVLYDIGDAYAAAGQHARALGAYKVAMAKFAQTGLLVQAVAIATRILEITGHTQRTLADIKRLPSLHTLTEQALMEAVLDPADEAADFSGESTRTARSRTRRSSPARRSSRRSTASSCCEWCAR